MIRMTLGYCTCPWPDGRMPYGQSWAIYLDGDKPMTCRQCGGWPRPEQDHEMASHWLAFERQKEQMRDEGRWPPRP